MTEGKWNGKCSTLERSEPQQVTPKSMWFFSPKYIAYSAVGLLYNESLKLTALVLIPWDVRELTLELSERLKIENEDPRESGSTDRWISKFYLNPPQIFTWPLKMWLYVWGSRELNSSQVGIVRLLSSVEVLSTCRALIKIF